MGLAVFAFLYPFITITARREEPGNAVAFTALCISGICFGFFIWTSISPNRITAVGSTVRVATFLSVAIFFYVSFLIIATYGMQFYLLPLAVTWAAILALLFRQNLLEDLCGKPVRQSLSALIPVVLTACLLTFFQHTSIPGSFFRRTGLVTFFCCVVIFFTTVLFLQDEKSHKTHKNVGRALLIGGGVIGVLGVLQFYDPWQAMSRWFPELQRDPRAIGTMGQANWFGTYLCLLLPLAIIELFTSTKTVGRFCFAALSGLLYAALVVCQTRGAWVAFSVFMLWLFIRQRSCRGKTLRLLLLFVVITVALVWSGNGKISSRLATLDSEIGSAKNFSPSTGSHRFAFWKFAIENLPAHVFLGSGLDTYELLPRPESGQAPTDKAHSIYFEYALTIGLPGLAAYLLFLWFCTTPPAGGSGNLRAWGFRASIGTYLLQGIFIHDTIRTWPLVWLIAGLAVTYRRMQGKSLPVASAAPRFSY